MDDGRKLYAEYEVPYVFLRNCMYWKKETGACDEPGKGVDQFSCKCKLLGINLLDFIMRETDLLIMSSFQDYLDELPITKAASSAQQEGSSVFEPLPVFRPKVPLVSGCFEDE